MLRYGMDGMTPTIFEVAEQARRKRHARQAGKKERRLKPRGKRSLKASRKTRRRKSRTR